MHAQSPLSTDRGKRTQRMESLRQKHQTPMANASGFALPHGEREINKNTNQR
jgi:hypothetical protein